MRLPKTAYILLWFPKPSETFVFREVTDLQKMGLPLTVFTLYGKLTKGLSQEMLSYSEAVERLGILFLKKAHTDLLHWWKKDQKRVLGLMRLFFLRKPAGLEKTGENLWAFLCAFRLARRFQEERISHIHAPWACGPATAAWIASQLTNIPFSFTARAADIFPPDSMLKIKFRDSLFVRTNNMANINYLRQVAGDNTKKIHMIYNGLTLDGHQGASVTMKPPYRLLAIGRFVKKKGYDDLIKACEILRDSGLDFRLTLVGDGSLRRQLINLTQKFDLKDRISFPGFVSHDHVSNLFFSSDIFLMPSIVSASGDRDGIPNVIMEALVHRVPVIATAVSGIPEVIEDGVTGLLIPEKDPSAISRAVLHLVRDRVSAVDMAERGRAKVRAQFDPEKNCRKVFLLYEQSHVVTVHGFKGSGFKVNGYGPTST